MKPFQKVAIVAGGYILCILLALAVVAVRIAGTSGSARQAASGMYGFGDSVLFVAAFGVPALVPTGAALFFLKPYARFWKVLSALGLALAATGVAAGILFAVGRHESGTRLAAWSEYSVLRMLVSPLLALAFLVCAAFAPLRAPRLALLASAAMEVAVCACVVAAWLVFQFHHRP